MTNDKHVSRTMHVHACSLILSFLHEHDLPLTQEVIDEVSALRNGSHQNMPWWQESESRLSWIKDLHSIAAMPTYAQIQEVKEIIEEAQDLYLEQFA